MASYRPFKLTLVSSSQLKESAALTQTRIEIPMIRRSMLMFNNVTGVCHTYNCR